MRKGKSGRMLLLGPLAAVLLAACASPPPAPRPISVARPRAVEPVAVRTVGPRPEVLRLARRAYECGRLRGDFRQPVLTIIDYSLPSTEPRLFVVDLDSGDVVFRELVAHGRGSGEDYAVAFSNQEGSKQSSLGLFRTAGTYMGGHGYSLRLVGLEPGVNDRAEERAIVMHAAPYATAEFAALHGRLGRSWGCPALDPAVCGAVIDRIKDGTALFAYYPDSTWLSQSPYLNCEAVQASAP